MSDDEYGLDDDLLLTDPTVLAGIEKAEKEALRASQQQQQRHSSRAGGAGTGTGIGSGSGTGGGYHHQVARPAVSRGRGRAHPPNPSTRPTTSHLAPQPQAQPQALPQAPQLINPNVPTTSTSNSHNPLTRRAAQYKPIPAPAPAAAPVPPARPQVHAAGAGDDDEEEDWGTDFFIDGNGNYKAVERTVGGSLSVVGGSGGGRIGNNNVGVGAGARNGGGHGQGQPITPQNRPAQNQNQSNITPATTTPLVRRLPQNNLNATSGNSNHGNIGQGTGSSGNGRTDNRGLTRSASLNFDSQGQQRPVQAAAAAVPAPQQVQSSRSNQNNQNLYHQTTSTTDPRPPQPQPPPIAQQQQQQQQQPSQTSASQSQGQGEGGASFSRSTSAGALARKRELARALSGEIGVGGAGDGGGMGRGIQLQLGGGGGSGSGGNAGAGNGTRQQQQNQNQNQPMDIDPKPLQQSQSRAQPQPQAPAPAAAQIQPQNLIIPPHHSRTHTSDIDALRAEFEAKLKAEREATQAARQAVEVEVQKRKVAEQEARTKNGEAVMLRSKKEAERKELEMKLAQKDEAIMKQEAERRKLEADYNKNLSVAQTKYTFDLAQAQQLPRFHSSQRQTRETPRQSSSLLPSRGGTRAPPQPHQTPTKSPSKNRHAPQTNRSMRNGDMGPPALPFPGLDTTSFHTPSARNKQRASRGPATPSAAGPSNFGRMQNGFSVDPASVLRPSKRAKQAHGTEVEEGQEGRDRADRAESELRNSPQDDMGGFGMGMDVDGPEEVQQLVVEEEEDVWYEGEEVDQKAAVTHLLFTHAYSSKSLDTTSQRIATIQRLLNGQTAQNLDPKERFKYDRICNDILSAVADSQVSVEDLCVRLVSCLVQALTILARSHALDTLVAVMDMIGVMGETLPAYDEAVTAEIAGELPSDLFISLTALCALDPVETGKQQPPKRPQTGNLDDGSAAESADLQARKVLSETARTEIGCGVLRAASVLGIGLIDLPEALVVFLRRQDGLATFLQPQQPFGIIRSLVDLTLIMATNTSTAKLLLAPLEETGNGMPTGNDPLIKALAIYLEKPHPGGRREEMDQIQLKILTCISTLCMVHKDAMIMLCENQYIGPSLVMMLAQKTEDIWGISVNTEFAIKALNLIVPALSLLHYLVFPPISTSGDSDSLNQRRPGEELQSRFYHMIATESQYPMACQTALGRIAWAHVSESVLPADHPQLILAQEIGLDLLDLLAEGPEADDFYDAYGATTEVVEPVPDDEMDEQAGGDANDPGADEVEALREAGMMGGGEDSV